MKGLHVQGESGIIFITFPLALFICLGILLGRLKNRFFVEYDYTFITGTIKIAKVIRQIKRKSVFDFDVSNIEKIGMYDSSTYNEYLAIPGISTMVLTSNSSPNEGKNFYYIVANIFGEKKLLIFVLVMV